jgi:hypothetical protein
MMFMYTVRSLHNFRKPNKQASKQDVCLAYTSTLKDGDIPPESR